MEFQINHDIEFTTDEALVNRARAIEIAKYHTLVAPKTYSKTKSEEGSFSLVASYPEEGVLLAAKNASLFDFGDHCVGRFQIELVSEGSPPDAPAKIYLYFGETLDEVMRDPKTYQGELSSSWIQEELLTVDVLPQTINLQRRFAFRYVYLEVVDTSPKYCLRIKLTCRTESSANEEKIEPLDSKDELLNQIDFISQKTLAHCMQDVFEDGPKRDRRLWLGDLRLQALANYHTFKENDLVKKCLYLFAAKTTNKGQVAANVFVKPELIPDDTFLADYSLFFIDTLLDYYKETGDETTLQELYPVALAQKNVLSDFVSLSGKIDMPDGWWAFIDWNDQLDKQVAIQGVFIYAYKRLLELTISANPDDEALISELQDNTATMEEWTLTHSYDKNRCLFLDPESNQLSVHSQAWMVLAQVGDSRFRKQVLTSLLMLPKGEALSCVSPYMYHHFVEALFQEDLREEAIRLLKEYWGGMILAGADTFWEVYQPDDLALSPYGDAMINSYCHAWSCTPCYLLRKYGVET